MTMKHNKKIISFILAFALIFSGMYFDFDQVDSLLFRVNACEVTSTLLPPDNFSDYPEYRSEEYTGARILANTIKSESRSDERGSSRTDLHLSIADILHRNFATFYITVSCELPTDVCSNSVIINYIHQTDGKK